jgi:hypothetical protein
MRQRLLFSHHSRGGGGGSGSGDTTMRSCRAWNRRGNFLLLIVVVVVVVVRWGGGSTRWEWPVRASKMKRTRAERGVLHGARRAVGIETSAEDEKLDMVKTEPL